MGFSAVAAASAVASVAGAAINSSAAGAASKEQAAAQNAAMAQQAAYYNDASGNLTPFITTGQSANSQLATLTGTNAGGNPLTAALTAQFQPTMDQLSATPGYQFSLNQGLKAAQNNLTAQGLGGSGQAEAGAANYAQGLASTTYNQQLQNYLAQNQQTYNMLNSLGQQGQGAATSLGNIGVGISNQTSQSETQLGNAEAAGTLGTANALSSGINGVANAASSYYSNNALLSMLGLNANASSSGSGLGGPNTL